MTPRHFGFGPTTTELMHCKKAVAENLNLKLLEAAV